MLPTASFLLQTATIQRFQSVNARGDVTYGANQSIAVRYEPSTRLLRDSNGAQAVSECVLYLIDQTVTTADRFIPPSQTKPRRPIRVEHFFDLLTGAYSYSAVHL